MEKLAENPSITILLQQMKQSCTVPMKLFNVIEITLEKYILFQNASTSTILILLAFEIDAVFVGVGERVQLEPLHSLLRSPL